VCFLFAIAFAQSARAVLEGKLAERMDAALEGMASALAARLNATIEATVAKRVALVMAKVCGAGVSAAGRARRPLLSEKSVPCELPCHHTAAWQRCAHALCWSACPPNRCRALNHDTHLRLCPGRRPAR